LSVDHGDFSSSVLRASGKLYLHGASAAPDAEIPLMMHELKLVRSFPLVSRSDKADKMAVMTA
jgi:hypothetical protein